MKEILAGIIGASGYTGAELLRLLAAHPCIKPAVVTGESQAGQEVSRLYPHLAAYKSLSFIKTDRAFEELKKCDVVFCALPHGEAMKIAPSLGNRLVIDLGADFRLKNAESYREWYHLEHSAPNELPNWQYGLPEFFREKVRSAGRIANPGCYPTISALCIAPLVKKGLLEGVINIDALSGTSGAGRVPSASLHFSHVYEDVRAYKVTKHQHTPEIEMVVAEYSGREASVTFTAHLIPAVRGIHATCSAQTAPGTGQEELFQTLSDAYKNEKFVRVTREQPGTKDVRGSNAAVISVNFDKRTGRAVITGVIDNLVKGASGQAVQNANIALGLDEDLGLSDIGLYP